MAALLIGIAAGSGGNSKTTKVSTPTTVTATITATAIGQTSTAPAATVTATATTSSTATVTATQTQTATETQTTTSQPSASVAAGRVPGDGSFIVGTDIQPGTYQTQGPASSAIPNCYWERDSSASGELSSIIANGNTQGSATVTVASTDKLFKTQGCQQWTKVG